MGFRPSNNTTMDVIQKIENVNTIQIYSPWK